MRAVSTIDAVYQNSLKRYLFGLDAEAREPQGIGGFALRPLQFRADSSYPADDARDGRRRDRPATVGLGVGRFELRAAKVLQMASSRLLLVVLEVESLDASLRFYRDLLGIPLVPDIDHGGDDRWISGAHAATSWYDGAFLHFALYQSKGIVTHGVQIGFPVDNLTETHERLVAAGVQVDHGPRNEPWGKTARYVDPDGNSVSLTESGTN